MEKVKTVLLVLSMFSWVFAVIARQISIENIADYDMRSGVFTVRQDYEVKPDELLIIPARAKIIFMPLTGINVKGELIIDGKFDEEVTLTSRSGTQGLGSAHDWRGIMVFPGARASINYAVISYASFGIRTCCDNVTLKNTVFLMNGVNFQIGERRMFITDREPTNYEIISSRINITHNSMGVDYDAIAGKKYIPLRTWILSPFAIGALVTGPVYLSKWSAGVKEYNNFGPGYPGFSDINSRERKFEQMQKDITFNAILGSTLTAVGLGLGSYTIYYTWQF